MHIISVIEFLIFEIINIVPIHFVLQYKKLQSIFFFV